jgi:hypothetical protein
VYSARHEIIEVHSTIGTGCGVECHPLAPPTVVLRDTSSRGYLHGTWKPPADAVEREDFVFESGPAGIRCHIDHASSPPELWTAIAPPSGNTTAPTISIRVSNTGTLITELPPDYVLEGSVLHGGALSRPVTLAPSHASATESSILASRDIVIVASTRSGCSCGKQPDSTFHEHIVTRVDVLTGVASVLDRGTGAVSARTGFDGTVYLQIGSTLTRYESGSAWPENVSMTGVLLTPPLDAPIECCSA